MALFLPMRRKRRDLCESSYFCILLWYLESLHVRQVFNHIAKLFNFQLRNNPESIIGNMVGRSHLQSVSIWRHRDGRLSLSLLQKVKVHVGRDNF